jgi:hypothetical protein
MTDRMMSGLTVATAPTILFVPALYATWFKVQPSSGRSCFNPLMAMAGATAIAEATEIVPVGVIPPDAGVTPGVLVDHLVQKEKVNGR